MVWKTNFNGDEPVSAPKPSKREHVHKFNTDSNVVSTQPGWWTKFLQFYLIFVVGVGLKPTCTLLVHLMILGFCPFHPS